MKWEDYKHVFISEGSSGNISIDQTCLQDWQQMINYLSKTDASLEYYVNHQKQELPAYIGKEQFSRKASCMFYVRLDAIQLSCPLLDVGNIILEFQPEKIDTELKAKVIFRLMSTLGRILDKPVILYTDDSFKQPAFSYRPGSGLEYCGKN